MVQDFSYEGCRSYHRGGESRIDVMGDPLVSQAWAIKAGDCRCSSTDHAGYQQE